MAERRRTTLKASLAAAAIALVVFAGLAVQRFLSPGSGGAPPGGGPGASPTAPIAPTPLSETEWRTRFAETMGGGDRITNIAVTSEIIAVQWAIAPFPSDFVRNDAMRRDVTNILRVVQASQASYGRVALRGTYRFDDPPVESQVFEATYSKRTIDAIDFAAADPAAILRQADTLALDGRFA